MKQLITGRNHYYAPAAHIIMSVEIVGSPSEADLLLAIRKAVHKHEIFSDKIILDEAGDCYCVASAPENIELKKMEGNGSDGLKQFVKEQQQIPFDFVNGDLIRFFYTEENDKTRILIVASHLVGDGLSIIYLIKDIMMALNDPGIDYEVQPLRLMEDFGYPEDSRLIPIVRLLLGQINKKWNKNKKVFSYDEYLDMFHAYWNDSEIELMNDMICGSDLIKLSSKCKERRITINSAIVAAFLYSLNTNRMGFPVNVRPDNYAGMGNYASGISINYQWDKKKSFWDNAESVHKIIYKKLSNNRKKYHVLQSLREFEPTLIDAGYFCKYAGFQDRTAYKVLKLFKYNDGQQLAMGITNLAKPEIPTTYGSYSINSIDFIPPLIPVNKSVLGVVTLNDKMAISMQYEKNCNSTEYIQAFDKAIRLLINNAD